MLAIRQQCQLGPWSPVAQQGFPPNANLVSVQGQRFRWSKIKWARSAHVSGTSVDRNGETQGMHGPPLWAAPAQANVQPVGLWSPPACCRLETGGECEPGTVSYYVYTFLIETAGKQETNEAQTETAIERETLPY